MATTKFIFLPEKCHVGKMEMEEANERKAEKRMQTEIVDRFRNWGTKRTLTHWNC